MLAAAREQVWNFWLTTLHPNMPQESTRTSDRSMPQRERSSKVRNRFHSCRLMGERCNRDFRLRRSSILSSASKRGTSLTTQRASLRRRKLCSIKKISKTSPRWTKRKSSIVSSLQTSSASKRTSKWESWWTNTSKSRLASISLSTLRRAQPEKLKAGCNLSGRFRKLASPSKHWFSWKTYSSELATTLSIHGSSNQTQIRKSCSKKVQVTLIKSIYSNTKNLNLNSFQKRT